MTPLLSLSCRFYCEVLAKQAVACCQILVDELGERQLPFVHLQTISSEQSFAGFRIDGAKTSLVVLLGDTEGEGLHYTAFTINPKEERMISGACGNPEAAGGPYAPKLRI
jgi:hypothetical protein